ncbi:hypothetical protein Tco_0940504 [Tanacetum coccineum]|uniref:Uncharacterized protein n=1 Tax=Tanacetum coccineum TaxID=301880 RepID=A0ABQ5DNQ7_9ASTR
MDDPNITIEEYIRLEEEKAQRQGQTFNWQTATYGKMEYCENNDDNFTNLETKYPSIVFDDTSDEALSCEPTVYILRSERVIPEKGDLRDYWIEISSDRDFLGPAPSYVYIRDPVRRLCHKMIACSISGRRQGAEKVTGVDLFYLRTIDRRTANVPYLLAQYLFRLAEGRKSGARLSRGHFIGRIAAHFGLVSDEGLRRLSIIARELSGPERQQTTAASAPGAAEDASAADEGAQAVPAPMQPPQLLPPALQHRTMSQRIDRLEEEVRELRQSVVGLRGVVESSITEQTRVST